MEWITSRTNPLMAHLRKLSAQRGYRRGQQEAICEGPKLLAEALRWGAAITLAVVEKEAAEEIVLPSGVRTVVVPHALLQWVSPTETPQKLLFLCQIPDCAPPAALSGKRYLILDGLQDPGNVGTIWRTADALEADGLFLLPRCADPWGPKTIRATMGACFRLPLWEATLEQVSALLTAAKLPLYAAALGTRTVALGDVSLERCGVVIGSEGRGVCPEVLERCDMALKIPMRDRCESLNAAVAAAVVLWEMRRA